MKALLLPILSFALITWFQAQTATVIPANEAAAHVNAWETVEGVVTKIFTSKSGNTFLNIGARYPNQTFTGWIQPASPVSKSPLLSGIEGKRVKITGQIEMYKEKPKNSDQCRLSARGRVSASSHARPNTDRDLDLIAQRARSINKAETTPGRNDNGQRPDVSLRAAQKASRTKTPIAVIKPASNARSSTASIKRVVGSLFFWRFMVIRGLPPGVRPIGHLFVCKWARSSAFIQVQRICRPVVSDDHGVLLLISGTSGFILRMGV